MASSKRRSEIHAVSIETNCICFKKLDGSASLLPQPGVLAKNQLPSVAAVPIVIPSLSRTCGSNDTDRLLCPVRSIKFYLDKVLSCRLNRKRLFIPVKGKGNISAASIARWIKSVIKFAYQDLSQEDMDILKIRPHELKALSTSWAFINQASLDDILRAASWKSQSTFSSYLRSPASQSDNLFSLGPLVVAQVVFTTA